MKEGVISLEVEKLIPLFLAWGIRKPSLIMTSLVSTFILLP